METATAAVRDLAARVGRERIIWRYDPLILGDGVLSPQAHRTRFRTLADGLEGATERVVLSLVDWYRKTARALRPHLDGDVIPGVRRCVPEDPEVLALVGTLREIAAEHGIEAVGCCEPRWQELGVLPGGACIDGALLNRLWGVEIPAGPDPGQRPGCSCATARDIGRYDTCSGGCRYCYATLAKRSDSL